MVKILDFNCVGNFWQKISVYMFSFIYIFYLLFPFISIYMMYIIYIAQNVLFCMLLFRKQGKHFCCWKYKC